MFFFYVLQFWNELVYRSVGIVYAEWKTKFDADWDISMQAEFKIIQRLLKNHILWSQQLKTRLFQDISIMCKNVIMKMVKSKLDNYKEAYNARQRSVARGRGRGHGGGGGDDQRGGRGHGGRGRGQGRG